MTRAPDSRREESVRRFPRLRVMLFLAFVVVTLNVAHVRWENPISPFDELFHIDYLHQVVDGKVLLQRDTSLRDSSLRELACRGHQVTGFPACDAPELRPRDFAWKGVNLAASHTPFYYVATAWPAEVLRTVSPVDLPLGTWGRLLNSVWLLLGVYLAVRIGDLFGAERWVTAAAMAALVASPQVLHSLGSVNPNNTAVLAGAGLLLAVVTWERRAAPLWAVPLAACAGSLLDSENNVAVLLVCIYLVIAGGLALLGRAGEHRPEWRSYLWCALLAALGAYAGQRGWSQILAWNENLTRGLDFTEAPNYGGLVARGGFPFRAVFDRQALFVLVPPYVRGVYVAPALASLLYGIAIVASGFVITGGLVAALFGFQAGRKTSTLAIATATALVAASPLLNVYNYVEAGTYDNILPRFGMALMPALLVVVAVSARTHVARALVWSAAGILYITAIIGLIP